MEIKKMMKAVSGSSSPMFQKGNSLWQPIFTGLINSIDENVTAAYPKASNQMFPSYLYRLKGRNNSNITMMDKETNSASLNLIN